MPKKNRWWGRGDASELAPVAPPVVPPLEPEPSEPEEVLVHRPALPALSDVDLEDRERRAEDLASSLEGEAHQTRQARARALQEIEKLRAAEQAAIQRAEREESEAERAAAERAQAEQIAHDLAQDEASATERAGAERASAENAARRRAEAERIAQEHAEIERKARERAAEEQAAAEEAAQRRVAAERTLAEIAESERSTSKRAVDLRELAQEATEQRNAAEAALDELRARERAMRARIAAERAAAAQMAAQRALSAQSALERAQAELAAAERAAAERAQLAHSIAERAAQAVAMAERAQHELGRAERSLADLEGGGGDAQSGGASASEEEAADADPDPEPDVELDPAAGDAALVTVSASTATEPVPAPPPEVAASAASDEVSAAEVLDSPPPPAPKRQAGSRGRNLQLFTLGIAGTLAAYWAFDLTGDADPIAPRMDPTPVALGVASKGEASAETTVMNVALPATPLAEEPPPQPPAATPTPAVDVALPAPKPVRDSVPEWLRNAVASAPWDGRPMIALVLEGLDAPAPSAAVLGIPAPLTLVYAADADSALAEAQRARRAGHELLGVLPAAGGSAQSALDPDLDTPELKQRLARSLERMSGFVGVRLPVAGGIAGDAPRLQIVLRELSRRGLLLVDTAGGSSTAAGFARKLETPFAVRDVELPAEASPEELGRQLASVERLARERGSAIASGSTSGPLVKAIERWVPLASSRGLRIVPLSAVVRHRAQPAR